MFLVQAKDGTVIDETHAIEEALALLRCKPQCVPRHSLRGRGIDGGHRVGAVDGSRPRPWARQEGRVTKQERENGT